MKINFINHACFSIETDSSLSIFDPWFTGDVFNNSWSLLRETDIDSLSLDKLKYIFITHEHPDHLHWRTLKQIKDSCTNELRIIIPKRRNSNVSDALRKMGFMVAEAPPHRKFQIEKDLAFTNYPTNHDSAYVLEAGDKIILNQNDCKLSTEQCQRIKGTYPNIDLYLMQFSLAGFYANRNDTTGLREAKNYHLRLIQKYDNFFSPSITIPFASFVYFSREKNKFLNDWIVSLNELSSSYQVLFYNDEVQWHGFEDRSKENIKKWEDLFRSVTTIKEAPQVSVDEVREAAQVFLNDLVDIPQIPTTVFEFYDCSDKLEINYQERRASIVGETNSLVAGVVTPYDMKCFFTLPWGADTLNITSCFDIKNQSLWKNNLLFVDSLYHR